MTAQLCTVLTRSGWKEYQQVAVIRQTSEVRALFMSRDVQLRLDQEKTNLEPKQLAGVFAKLNRFVQGKSIAVSTPRVGGSKGDIKVLKGYGDKIFEMRFFEVAPQLRMLGVFPQKDVFLGVSLLDRSSLEGNWGAEVKRVTTKLSAMGKDRPECLGSQNVDALLSNWCESI